MIDGAPGPWFSRPLVRDYGMSIVLVVLILLFTGLTIGEQHPNGVEAGREVADAILADHGAEASVLIVTRKTTDDLAFAEGARERLTAGGVTIVGPVHGAPADATRTIRELLAEGRHIDAIAANEATAAWTVYDKFPEVGAEKCVAPAATTWPVFLKRSNLLGVANQTAVYAIIAIGMTMVIITSGIDLSVGSLVALSSVTCALVLRDWGGGADAGLGMVLLAVLISISLCALAGFFNGFLVTTFGLPPFIVTLGMMLMASGLAYRLAEGASIGKLPSSLTALGQGRTAGIPNQVLLMIALYLVAHVVMSRMVFGRYVYAIGGNADAARLSGVSVTRVLLVVYTISALLAGLGGVILTSQLAAGAPTYGQMYELEVIAAVVVGGTSLMGGRGKVLSTLIGAFIIAVIKNGMNLTKVDPFNQNIVLGAVLTGAVLLDTLKRRGLRH
ncbi:MAG: ABC transporter permease [Planctomycetaceae bacterium]|nr:ABC transporter permease [Planctomycetaceae bacterium]